MIEKLLLVRLKDRNPAPLQNLELLFEGTCQQLLELADAVENAQQQLKFHGTRLSAGTRLLLLLIRLRFSLAPEDAELLEAHLSPLVEETPDQGWEERTDAALAHLLRTALDKSSKDTASSTATQQLTRPADAAKLKKHITLVCDRLHKGLRPRSERTAGDKERRRECAPREAAASSSSSAAPALPPSPTEAEGDVPVVAGVQVAPPPQGRPAPPGGALPPVVGGQPLPPVVAPSANGDRPHLNGDRPLPSPPE